MGADGDKPSALPEDCPLVKQLKEIDDRYLDLQKEYERECQKLLVQYSERQQPLLEERRKVLTTPPAEGKGSKTGTPALSGFWLMAMQNHPTVGDGIQEWDEPVLEYLCDVEKSNVDNDSAKGFKLVFHFTENPYFTNTEVWKEYTTELTNPYCGEIEVKEIKCSKIEWKSGKDVTVERLPRKMKGGGPKKGKRRDKEEPRPSFFRDFFRDLHRETKLEEDAREQALVLVDDEGDDDDDNLLMCLMESDHEIGTALRDCVVPFAVRWYTGEASPDEDDDDFDDEEEEEEEEEEEIDEEEEDDEDESPAKARMLAKGGQGQKRAGKSSDNSKLLEKSDGKEECKQQ